MPTDISLLLDYVVGRLMPAFLRGSPDQVAARAAILRTLAACDADADLHGNPTVVALRLAAADALQSEGCRDNPEPAQVPAARPASYIHTPLRHMDGMIASSRRRLSSACSATDAKVRPLVKPVRPMRWLDHPPVAAAT